MEESCELISSPRQLLTLAKANKNAANQEEQQSGIALDHITYQQETI